MRGGAQIGGDHCRFWFILSFSQLVASWVHHHPARDSISQSPLQLGLTTWSISSHGCRQKGLMAMIDLGLKYHTFTLPSFFFPWVEMHMTLRLNFDHGRQAQYPRVKIDREETLVPQMLLWSRTSSPPTRAVKREIKKDIDTVLLNIFFSSLPFFLSKTWFLGSSSLAALCWVFWNTVLSTWKKQWIPMTKTENGYATLDINWMGRICFTENDFAILGSSIVYFLFQNCTFEYSHLLVTVCRVHCYAFSLLWNSVVYY